MILRQLNALAFIRALTDLNSISAIRLFQISQHKLTSEIKKLT